jgi:hypothetical protein
MFKLGLSDFIQFNSPDDSAEEGIEPEVGSSEHLDEADALRAALGLQLLLLAQVPRYLTLLRKYLNIGTFQG